MESGVRFSNYEARRLYPAFPHQLELREVIAPTVVLDLSICVLLCVPQSFHREDIILRKETKCIKFLENIRYVVAQRVVHSFLFLDV